MLTAAQKLALLKSTLKRGSICHWRQPFGPHFAVILNLDWPPPEDVVYFSIMTSKTAKFSSFIEDEIIRTGPKDYPFLSSETVIDLRIVHEATLPVVCAQPEFGVKGSLTVIHLELIDEILRRSETVEEIILQRIVAR